jgi:anti-sigma B factor antagonist
MLTVLESDPASDLLVVGLQGELDLSTLMTCQQQMREALTAFAPDSPPRIILDLSECRFLDSSGMMFLIERTKAARKSGGAFILAGLTPRLARVFQGLDLNLVFAIADTIEQAKAMSRSEQRKDGPET